MRLSHGYPMAPRSRTAPIGVAWRVADPLALIGTSNFFELAVATAIALFGFQAGAALATVVGVLERFVLVLERLLQACVMAVFGGSGHGAIGGPAGARAGGA